MIYQSMFNPLPDEDVYTKEEIDEALENKIEAPMATPELGWFSGMGDALGHGIASAGLKTVSNAEEVLAGTVHSALSQYENETGDELPSLPGQEEQSIEEREQAIVEQIDAEAKELRRVAREEYGINEQTMGAASQVVFGLTEGLTKAIGYTMMMGPGLGAYAYGADYGMSTFHEARDEGVDFGTALMMGGVSAVSGALGLRVPATFGRSRTQSAVLGALVNMGFTGAEAETISFILDTQGYSKLAQRHQADITSLIVSGLFGGVMGGALYRAKPKLGETDQRIEGEQAYQTPEEKYREQLKDTGLYSTEQAEDLASIHGLANRNLAKLAGLSEEDAVAFTAEVDFVDDIGGNGLNQIIGPKGATHAMHFGNGGPFNGLNKARLMEADGKSVGDIFKETGWERGADGKWRFEIPDIKFKEGAFNIIKESNNLRDEEINQLYAREGLTDDEYINSEQAIVDRYEQQTLATTLDQIVEAPELFKAYPELRGLTVEFGEVPKGTGAYYSDIDKRIRLPRRADIFKNSSRSSLAHEIQHAIQDIEGFSTGDNPKAHGGFGDEFQAEAMRLDYLKSTYKEDIDAYQKALADYESYLDSDVDKALEVYDTQVSPLANKAEVKEYLAEKERVANWLRLVGNEGDVDALAVLNGEKPLSHTLVNDLNEKYGDAYKEKRYRQKAGETEGRNVQIRLELSEEQRRNTPLYVTEDIPRSLQDVGRLSERLYKDQQVSLSEQVGNIERIEGWLSEDNLSWAKGKTRSEIFEHFGNELEPIAFIPEGWLSHIFNEKVTDNRVYSGKGYFIDHIVNHHPDVDHEAYALIQEMISKHDEIILDKRDGKDTAIFVKQYDKNYLVVVSLDRAEDGKLHFYKTMLKTSNKKPYPKLDRAELPVDAHSHNMLIPNKGHASVERLSDRDNIINSITQNEASVNGEFFQTAYHGTPHVFDKFNLQAIGTGEGAQAHGWGLYFAKNREVAEGYRERLATGDWGEQWTVNGKSLDELTDKWSTFDGNVLDEFLGHLKLHKNGKKATLAQLERAYEATLKQAEKDEFSSQKAYDEYLEKLEQLKEELPNLNITRKSTDGRVFEVDVPDDSVFLDEQKYMGSSRGTDLRSKIEWIIQEWDDKHPNNPLSLPESPNGREIYQAISDELGGPKEASLYLNRYGIKGITYDGLRDGRCYVVFDDEAIKVLDFYQKSMDQGQVRGSYNPKTNKIKLTPNADLSTFSHEMSHFYLDKMIDLSTNYSSVDYQVKTDMDNLLKYYGVKEGLKGWDSLDFEQQRKVQEQFASHSEIYLSTGKAPSRTLKRAFERLGMWILSVYRYLGGVEHGVSERYKAEFGEDLPSLSPEVKKVLDRLYSDIEAKAKEEVKNAKVDNETVAAARVLLTKIATNKKLMAILRKAKDRNAPLTKEEEEYATNMLRSLEIANNQINASQAVSVAQNFSDAPVDLDLIRKHSDQFVKTYNSGDVVLQNRDRSSKSSIAQMKSIASNPDYGRLGYSTSLANGAPVIGYADSIPAEQLGKESFMVDSEGKRYPTQYAVVDADSVLTSNAIDGTHNASYYEDNGAMKAIAGNGRITALNEAYRLGTIGKYLEEFKDDTLHGVPKAVIEKLKKPILVRIMRNEDITADIGDISNRSDSQQLSDVEQAMTDAQRINLDELRYTEDGDITADSVAQFLSVLPAEERARMIDRSGMPKKSAYARLERAIFQATYGSPSATELLDSVEKTGVSRLLSAYRQLGTSLMGLAGELDFRPSMLDVLSEIRNAKLSGNLPSIQELASQVNITRSPEADAILRFLAKNEEAKGGVQGIVNTFRDLADFAKANMDSASQGVDLFGEVVNPTRLDLMRKFSEITGVEIDEAAIQKAMDEAKQIAETVQRATDDVVAKVEETQMIEETPVTQKDVESSAGLFEEAQALEAEREQAMKVLTNPEETMVQNLAVERPDAVYKVKDAEGNDVTLTAQEILEMNQKNLEQAKIEQSALGRAAECVINNNGLGV